MGSSQMAAKCAAPVATTTISLKRKSPGVAGAVPVAPSNALVRVVERSILRSLAFVLHHLDQSQARYCVRSILQWYGHLQRRLPLFAVDSLNRFATSFVALSDAEFTAFWLSLAEDSACHHGDLTRPECIEAEAEDARDRLDVEDTDCDTTLLRRLYQQLSARIHRLFGIPSCVRSRALHLHAQTPLTSPDDKYDERQYFVRSGNLALSATLSSSGVPTEDYDLGENVDCMLESSEPGWAVEYMEQESKVSTEITQRMRRMMHSSIPLNLFRVKVVYPASPKDGDVEGLGGCGLIGVVSPDSFPPTPITRDLQARRIHHYTATVLDHATLALRLLDTNYCTG